MRKARPIRVFAYDIVSNSRRARISAILEDRAVRVQESVFEARLTRDETVRLIGQLERILLAEDKLRVYTVPDSALPDCRAFGGTPLPELEDFWLL